MTSIAAENAPENADFIGCWNENPHPEVGAFPPSCRATASSTVTSRYLFSASSGGSRARLWLRLRGDEPRARAPRRSAGEVLGLDCTEPSSTSPTGGRDEAGPERARRAGDAQDHPLRRARFDVAFARFGVMFFESAVRALRNVHRSLVPGGNVCLIVWREASPTTPHGARRRRSYASTSRRQGRARQTCGPGPFSWGDEETDRRMLAAGGFEEWLSSHETTSTCASAGPWMRRSTTRSSSAHPARSSVKPAKRGPPATRDPSEARGAVPPPRARGGRLYAVQYVDDPRAKESRRALTNARHGDGSGSEGVAGDHWIVIARRLAEAINIPGRSTHAL